MSRLKEKRSIIVPLADTIKAGGFWGKSREGIVRSLPTFAGDQKHVSSRNRMYFYPTGRHITPLTKDNIHDNWSLSAAYSQEPAPFYSNQSKKKIIT
jgi:hypothetical protein